MDVSAGPSDVNKRSLREKTSGNNKKKKLSEEEIVRILENIDYDSDESDFSSDDECLFDPVACGQDTSSSSECEDDSELQSENMEFSSSNIWSNKGTVRKINLSKSQQLLVPVPGEGTPLDFFELIIDNQFLQMVVDETNSFAVRLLVRPGTTDKSRITRWKDITVEELKIFLGLVLHTGTITLSRLCDYWNTGPLFDIPVFRKFMSRNRFLIIMRCLHFSSEEDPDDRLAKIRPVIDFFNNKMQSIYYPGRELSLDEAMVLWRGRLQFRQYIKNKRHKYGIKLYMLTEPNGLVLKFRVYEGSSDVYSGVGHTQKVVLHLLQEKLGNGHAVYLDNYYNSVELASKLLEEGTYCTGTLRIDRKQNPKEVMSANLKKGENKSMFCNGIHVGKWRDKRNVQYITTEFKSQMVLCKNKRGHESEKPAAIAGYNKSMSGVDRQDQMMAYYPCSRKTIFWYKKLFLHVIQMSLINAYYLYNHYSHGNRGRLYEFRLAVIGSLLSIKTDIVTTLQLTEPMEGKAHAITKIEKQVKEIKGTNESKRVSRKECRVCKQRKIRKQTVYECKMCPGQPGFCLKCFTDYHVKM